MIIAISQRRIQEYSGADVLEASYPKFFCKLGVNLIPIPNDPENAIKFLSNFKIDGIILSGGGDVQPILYGGNVEIEGNYAPERDATEKILIETALKNNIPLLGICRGLQSINVYFGGKIIQSLEKDFKGSINHRNTRHMITISDMSIKSELGKDQFEINSYHNLGLDNSCIAPDLIAFALAPDNSIEGVYHPQYRIAGIMWHPERETEPSILNDLLVNAFLKREYFWKYLR